MAYAVRTAQGQPQGRLNRETSRIPRDHGVLSFKYCEDVP
jgi:hypothetical protein